MFLDHFMQEILRLRLRFGRRDDPILRIQSVRWSNGIVVTAFRLCDERYDLSSRVPIGRQQTALHQVESCVQVELMSGGLLQQQMRWHPEFHAQRKPQRMYIADGVA